MGKSIFHVITSTEVGGAEIMLEKFLSHHDSAKRTTVVSLTTVGEVGRRMDKLGAAVIALNIHSPLTAFIGLLRFAKLIYKSQPQTVIAWMYHANLLAALCSLIHQRSYLVWNVRCGISQYITGKLSKIIVLRVSRILSRLPDKIIFNSKRSMQEHTAYGYCKRNCRVVYNGFELKSNSAADRAKIRNEIGIGENVFLIGSFGRNIRLKRMADLLAICAKLRATGFPVELLYVGRSFDTIQFKEEIEKHGMTGYVHVVPEVPSLSPYYSALDAFGLCSDNEGFPNVIGEAVFSEVPVFCTDVGDMKNDFLKSWQVSPVGDIPSLTHAVLRILNMGYSERRDLAREQLRHFSNRTEINHMVSDFDRLFFPQAYQFEN